MCSEVDIFGACFAMGLEHVVSSMLSDMDVTSLRSMRAVSKLWLAAVTAEAAAWKLASARAWASLDRAAAVEMRLPRSLRDAGRIDNVMFARRAGGDRLVVVARYRQGSVAIFLLDVHSGEVTFSLVVPELNSVDCNRDAIVFQDPDGLHMLSLNCLEKPPRKIRPQCPSSGSSFLRVYQFKLLPNRNTLVVVGLTDSDPKEVSAVAYSYDRHFQLDPQKTLFRGKSSFKLAVEQSKVLFMSAGRHAHLAEMAGGNPTLASFSRSLQPRAWLLDADSDWSLIKCAELPFSVSQTETYYSSDGPENFSFCYPRVAFCRNSMVFVWNLNEPGRGTRIRFRDSFADGVKLVNDLAVVHHFGRRDSCAHKATDLSVIDVSRLDNDRKTAASPVVRCHRGLGRGFVFRREAYAVLMDSDARYLIYAQSSYKFDGKDRLFVVDSWTERKEVCARKPFFCWHCLTSWA